MRPLDIQQLKQNLNLQQQVIDFTWFLPDKSPLWRRIWHWENHTQQIPACEKCGINLVGWNTKTRRYSRFCSSKCAHAHDSVRKKTRDTCMERFGATSNLASPQNRSKQRQTLEKRYGVDNFAKSPGFKQKYQQTCQERYGVSNASQLDWVKTKINQTHQQKYGRKRYSQIHIPPDIIDLKNDIQEMRRWYFDLKMPVIEIAKVLGISNSQLSVHFKENLGIDITRHRVSLVERQITEYIRCLGISDIETSNREIIAPKEIDIVLPGHGIGIEVNGLAWHSELRGKDRYYHANKTRAAAAQGLRLIQITDWEWNNRQEIVKSRLGALLGKNRRIFARNTKVKVLTAKAANQFTAETHIQGTCPHQLALGLVAQDQLVAVMTFGRPRYNRSFQWELLRFSTQLNTNVVGGAGKLFAQFCRDQSPDTVISYCDLRWNLGGVYEALGFQRRSQSGPNYWYTRGYDSFENRMRYQKHRLAKLLENFDPSLTEWQNMIANGYDRFWDCGNAVYAWSSRSMI